VTQQPTRVTASLVKIRVNKLHPCFGVQGVGDSNLIAQTI